MTFGFEGAVESPITAHFPSLPCPVWAEWNLAGMAPAVSWSKLYEIVVPEVCGSARFSGEAAEASEKTLRKIKIVRMRRVSKRPEMIFFCTVILLCKHTATPKAQGSEE